MKSPLASTTPAGVSIARARLSRTLCATRIGWTRKGPTSTGWPGVSVPQVRVDAALLEPLAREAEGEAASVDGRGRGLQRERERADVVLVAVGEEDPADRGRALGEVLEVGDDGVDAGHLGGREEHPRVEQQEVRPPTRARARSGRTHRARRAGRGGSPSWSSASARINLSPPVDRSWRARQIAANSTTDSVSARLDPSTLRNLKYSLRLG